MTKNTIVEQVKRKKVLGDNDIKIFAEYERERYFGRVERAE